VCISLARLGLLPAVPPPDEVRRQHGVAGAVDLACLAVIHTQPRATTIIESVGATELGEDGLRVLSVQTSGEVLLEARRGVELGIAALACPPRRLHQLPVPVIRRPWSVPVAATVLCHVPAQWWESRCCLCGLLPCFQLRQAPVPLAGLVLDQTGRDHLAQVEALW
jgi:hypothetical protein